MATNVADDLKYNPFRLARVIDNTAGKLTTEEAQLLNCSSSFPALNTGYYGLYERSPSFEWHESDRTLKITARFMLAPLFMFDSTTSGMRVDWGGIGDDSDLLNRINTFFWHCDHIRNAIDYCAGKFKDHEPGVFCTYCDELDIDTPLVSGAIKEVISEPVPDEAKHAGRGSASITHHSFRTWTTTRNVKLDSKDVASLGEALALVERFLKESTQVQARGDVAYRKEQARARSALALAAEMAKIDDDANSAALEYEAMCSNGRSVPCLTQYASNLKRAMEYEKELAELKAQQILLKSQLAANEARIQALSASCASDS